MLLDQKLSIIIEIDPKRALKKKLLSQNNEMMHNHVFV